MGIWDTMQGAATGMGNGGSFAQKQQMKANPMMQGRPAMGAPLGQTPQVNAFTANKMQKPNNNMANPMAQMQKVNANAGQAGSRTQIQAKQQAMKQQQQAQTGIGPTDPVQQLQQTLSAQKGLQTPYDQQQQAQVQAQTQAATQPYQEPAVDLGSQDPRELARVAQQNQTQGMSQLYGSAPDMPGPNPMEQQIMASKPNVQMGASQAGPAIGAMGQTMGQEIPTGGGIGGSGIDQVMQRMGQPGGMQRSQVMPRRR